MFSSKSFAQNYKHTTFWSRLAFQKEIKNWNFRFEMDYRQQNDFQKSLYNPLQRPLMRWARFYTSYETGNFTHTLILPNIVKSYPLVGCAADLNKPSSVEWRFTFNEEYSKEYKKLTSNLRAGYEFRNITNNNITKNTGRFRLRLSETLSVTKKNNLNISFEQLFNVPPNKQANTLNSTQLAFRYIHEFSDLVSFTTGINHVYRQRSTLIEYDMENAILCNLIISL